MKTKYLGYQNGKIKFYTDNILDKEIYNLDKIEATQDTYILENNDYIKVDNEYINNKLAKAKETKLKENLEKAYLAEETGSVLYKNAIFETSAANLSKIISNLTLIQTGAIDSVQWLSKDDVQFEFTESDLKEIAQLVTEYTGALWNVQYLCFKEKIEEASDTDKLNQIKIEY